MLHRKKNPYANMYNGVGGKIESGETPDEGAVRELYEECEIGLHEVSSFRRLVSSIYPNHIELHVYYAKLTDDSKMDRLDQKIIDEGQLVWMEAKDLLDVTRTDVAGEGNAAYFIYLSQITDGYHSNK